MLGISPVARYMMGAGSARCTSCEAGTFSTCAGKFLMTARVFFRVVGSNLAGDSSLVILRPSASRVSNRLEKGFRDLCGVRLSVDESGSGKATRLDLVVSP
jgi:hypothetical protein